VLYNEDVVMPLEIKLPVSQCVVNHYTFVAIAKNTLHESKLSTFLLPKIIRI